MKYALLLSLCLMACTRTVTFIDDAGKVVTKDIENSEIASVQYVVEKNTPGEITNGTNSCKKSGFCCTYNMMNFYGKSGYHCGLNSGCPGSREVTRQNYTEVGHTEVKLKTGRVLVEPSKATTGYKTLSTGSCQ